MRSAPRRDGPRPLPSLVGDRGSITAEFAVVVPVVLVILGLAVGAVLLATHRLTLASAALEIARLEARGDSAAAAARVASMGDETEIMRSRDGPLLCVTLVSRPGGGVLHALEISARGCAAAPEDGGGR